MESLKLSRRISERVFGTPWRNSNSVWEETVEIPRTLFIAIEKSLWRQTQSLWLARIAWFKFNHLGPKSRRLHSMKRIRSLRTILIFHTQKEPDLPAQWPSSLGCRTWLSTYIWIWTCLTELWRMFRMIVKRELIKLND